MSDGFDVDAFLDGYSRRAEEVTIYGRLDLAAEHARLEAELADVASSGDHDADGHIHSARAATERLAEIEAEIEASATVWRIEAVPRDVWHLLVVEHPPSDEERRQSGGKEAVGASFWPAAIAACCVSPKVTVEQAQRMSQTLRTEDYDRLRLAVQQVNEGAGAVPKSQMGSAVRRLLDASSTSPKGKGSRGGSSTAGKGARSRSTTGTKKAG